MAHVIVANRTDHRKSGAYAAVLHALETLWIWRKRAQQRAEARRVLERADDRMLQDIGITRSMLVDSASRPFWRP